MKKTLQTLWLWIRHPWGMWKLHHLTVGEKHALQLYMLKAEIRESLERH